VQLKSGGPVMTVDEITNDRTRTVWFAYGQQHHGHFGVHALQAASVAAEKKIGKSA